MTKTYSMECIEDRLRRPAVLLNRLYMCLLALYFTKYKCVAVRKLILSPG